MGRKRAKQQPGSRLSQVLLEAAFWVLLTQLLGTAIYFTGKFSNPQAHKELIAQFGAAVAVGLWFLAQAARGQIRIRFSAYYLPLLLLVVWSAIRTATSVTPLSTRKWILVAQVVAALPVWVELMESPRRRLFLSWAVFLIGCVMAGGALIESFGYYPYPLISQYSRQSVGSFVGHNNPMAAYLLVASIHAIGLLVRFRDRPWSKVFWGFLVINLYLFILSGSRGAWLSFPFAMGILFLSLRGLRRAKIQRQTVRRVALSVFACFCAGFIAVGAYSLLGIRGDTPGVIDRIRDLGNAFSGTYPRVWTTSILMIADRPLAGVGFAAWAHQYPFYQGRWFSEHPDTHLGLPGIYQHTQRSHSDYLQLVAELGVIGLVGLLWLLLIHIREVWKFLTAKSRSIAATVGLSAMAGTLAHALVYFPFHAADSACPFLANCSLFIAARGKSDRIIQLSGPMARWGAALAAVFFLLVATRPVGKNVTADVLTGRMAVKLQAGEKSELGWRGYKAGADLWQSWASQYEKKGDTDSAIQSLKQAKLALEKSLELDPHYPQTNYQYGFLCMKIADMMNKTEERTNLYQNAMKALEKSLQTYVWHGTYHLIAECATQLWQTTGDKRYLTKAIENHEKGLAIYPLNYKATADLGKLYYEQGNRQATIDLYYKTRARFMGQEQDFVEVLYNQGLRALKAHNEKDADFYLSISSSLDPEDSNKRLTLALFYLGQGGFDAVLNILKQHLEKQPNELELPARIFNLWIQRGDPRQAAETASQLFSAVDAGPTFQNQLRMVLSSFLLLGKYNLADDILANLPPEKANKMAKDRALTQWLKGDPSSATETWGRWLQDHKGDADSQVGLVGCLKVLLAGI